MKKGFDISHHNNDKGTFDWNEIKGDGYDFAFVKATEGTSYVDPFFDDNVRGAKSIGLKVGAYHFARFGNEADVKAELNHFIGTIDPENITYPAVLDVESNDHKLSKSRLTDLVIIFLEGLEKAGFFAMIYTGKYFMDNNLDESRLTKYAKWIAKYSSTLGRTADIWQYTSSGHVDGITGNVDVNISYRDDLFGDTDNEPDAPKKVDKVEAQPPKPTESAPIVGSNENSIVDYLNSKGIDSGFANREKLAKQYGISNYQGTADQNTALLNKMKQGKPASKPSAPSVGKGDMKTTSVVDYLNSIKVDSGFDNRKRLATKYGIKNYNGSASQNTQLLDAMRGNKAPVPQAPVSPYLHKRLVSKVNGLRFYNTASWADNHVVGHVDKGVGFPFILGKYKVEDGYQYRVKNSNGKIYYITASDKYVDVE